MFTVAANLLINEVIQLLQVRQCKMERKNILEFKGKIDFGIITIKSEEYLSLLKRFSPIYEVEGERRYSISCIKTSNNDYYWIALVRCAEQGESVGQKTAENLIKDIDPEWLLLVGIAGGIPSSDFSLGDVILANRLHSFSLQAVYEGGITNYGNRGGPMHPVIDDLLAQLPAYELEFANWHETIDLERPIIKLQPNNFYGDESWKEDLKEKLEKRFKDENKFKNRSKHVVAPIASSNKLIKDTKVIQQWKSSARYLQAVEMELAGIYEAARRKNKTYPILAIRGISDIIGFNRDEEWTMYACEASAAFTFEWMNSGTMKKGLKQLPYISKEEGESKIQFSIVKLNNIKRVLASNQHIWKDQLKIFAKTLSQVKTLLISEIADGKQEKDNNYLLHWDIHYFTDEMEEIIFLILDIGVITNDLLDERKKEVEEKIDSLIDYLSQKINE